MATRWVSETVAGALKGEIHHQTRSHIVFDMSTVNSPFIQPADYQSRFCSASVETNTPSARLYPG
ncbi:hypothetical protein I7I48_01619 [Histoplasma ohiense]|nr:hypothetical protein I7I48_01619 [Histoplasma ohiense (nom. inval.)]